MPTLAILGLLCLASVNDPQNPPSELDSIISIFSRPEVGSFVVQGTGVTLFHYTLDGFDEPEIELAGVADMEFVQSSVAIHPKREFVASVETLGSDSVRTFLFKSYMSIHDVLHGLEDYGEVEFSSDGKFLSGFSALTALRWKIEDGSVAKALRPNDWLSHFIPGSNGALLIDDKDRIHVLAPTQAKLRSWPNGDGILFHSKSGLRAMKGNAILEVPSRKVVSRVQLPKEFTEPLKFSPSGTWVASRSDDKTLLLVVSLDNSAPPVLIRKPLIAQGYAFLSDKSIAVAGDDVEFYELATGKRLLTLRPNVVPRERTPYPHGPQWAIWTDEGLYAGSDHCLDWMDAAILKREDPAEIGRMFRDKLGLEHRTDL